MSNGECLNININIKTKINYYTISLMIETFLFKERSYLIPYVAI